MKRTISRVVSLFAVMLCVVEPAFAAEGGSSLGALGAGIGIGVAALGGALAQGSAISAALNSIGRNPTAAGKLFNPMVLGLVFIETLVIFALVISLGVRV